MLHTLAVYVEDKPGVLNRIASLFRRRAFNIDSLTVGHTEQPGVSRMTIVCDVDDTSARRVEANVYKLVNVLRVDDLTHVPSIARELALIKVSATLENRSQIMQLASVFRARVVDVSPDSLIVETTGTSEKIDRLLEVLKPYTIVEVARTGRVAMARGARPAPSLEDRFAGVDAEAEGDTVAYSV
ncbi:MAG TPA: acetolactate synthase small subunit [Vicinamibacterales bacterium]|nr:acetolactate synthase small subunit [Vicinamibacterales bacterium]